MSTLDAFIIDNLRRREERVRRPDNAHVFPPLTPEEPGDPREGDDQPDLSRREEEGPPPRGVVVIDA